ncbi:hypothetical protein DO70_6530 [Burkholderia pseudomallei]|nr:hypothetical protein DO70_6530 [Burkholderia pseudomallei]
MDHARRLRRGVADVDRPRAHFLHARGEVRLQPEQLEARTDHAVEARLVHAHVGEERFLVGIVEIGDLRLDRRAHRDDRRLLAFRVPAHRVEMRIVLEAVFLHVRDVHRRLRGDQAERLEERLLVVGQIEPAHGLALVEVRARLVEHRDELRRFLVVARFRRLRIAGERLLDGAEVGERELGVDDFDVVERAHLAGDVDDVLVLEAAHDVRDRIGFADVREELVAEALALARAGDEARDVDEFDDGRHDALGLDDFGERLQACVRHLDDADVRLDRAERIVLGGDAGLRQRVEQGGLADVGQADDAAFEAHGFLRDSMGYGWSASHVECAGEAARGRRWTKSGAGQRPQRAAPDDFARASSTKASIVTRSGAWLGPTRGTSTRRRRSVGTTGLRDYGTTGLRDYGTTGLRDYGTAEV